jgi:predicted nucleic-acid-binding protein
VIGVDSNVLLRHLLQDDDVQSPLASRFFASRSPEDPAFLSQLVLAEVIWTLERAQRLAPEEVRRVMRDLLSSADVVVENSIGVRRAVRDAEQCDAGLADAIIAHAAIDAGCDGIVTFDRRALDLPGMLPLG